MSGTVSVRAAAKVLDVHENTVRNWISSGRLAYVETPGGRRRPTAESVLDLAAETPAMSDVDAAAMLDTLAEDLEARARHLREAAATVRELDTRGRP
jgi:excisionase family DNA binding protein